MRDMSPVLRAFYVYTALVHYIHPFHDGNGRISRLLCNSILQAYGFVSVLQYSDKIITFEEYLHKLEACTEAYRNIRANMTVR
ncbi:hypothetical protein SARC_13766 [Sphaeroforma arctica JP610]|uniref:Fido domain-containing protein n=1 Tax=Sphaeroforma arctica JP610 TaxID=667725 RepID=A0A0L0FAA7_9EUKA|nr:hypothetical protein SARC_13766 [Sphaeroforma arctica JP610]KNC73675.1 hypothetical protein SARC_13766 [Sphaeroforma arctica JP610]|eukprot:XP_014147577.1 hypothetical protein SARC_13766 [Sphaeroforma arctica JP610]